jgi:hypothetical protein
MFCGDCFLINMSCCRKKIITLHLLEKIILLTFERKVFGVTDFLGVIFKNFFPSDDKFNVHDCC